MKYKSTSKFSVTTMKQGMVSPSKSYILELSKDPVRSMNS